MCWAATLVLLAPASGNSGVDTCGCAVEQPADGSYCECAPTGPCVEPNILNVVEFLPAIECERPPPRQWGDGWAMPPFPPSSCEATLVESLTERHRDPGCEETVAAGFMNYGLGSTFHYLIMQMQRAARDRKPIAFSGEWVYGGCPARDFTCAFDPVSHCNRSGAALTYPRMVAEPLPWVMEEGYAACAQGRINALFHFISTLAGFLFRPNADMRRAAREAGVRMGLPERYLGVHVRNGDFCHAHTVTVDPKECHPATAFADALLKASQATGVTDVYIATDNADTIPVMQGLCPELSFFFNTEVRRDWLRVSDQDLESGEIFLEQRLFKADLAKRQNHLQEIMVDIMLLARSEAMVGQFTSNISRLVVALGTFLRAGSLLSFVSLDHPWCWNGFRPTDFGKKFGRNFWC